MSMPPARVRSLGAGVGVSPQVLLLALLIAGLVTSGTVDARRMLVLLVVPEVMIVPIAVLVWLACLLEPAARPFGRGVLGGTLISAAVFIPVCFVTTSA